MTHMTSVAQPGARTWPRAAALLRWRTAVGLAGIIGGAVVIAGCLLPWASAFAGLVSFAGISGTNGRALAVVGTLTVGAGGWHLIRGSDWSRLAAGLAGFAGLCFAGWLLLRLAATLRALGGDDMVILRGGPGLWVAAAGSLVAFAVLFLPASDQRTLQATSEDAAGGLRAWAADTDSGGTRRALQLGLGLVWLLDAALQFQPFMFGRGFATQIIEPAAQGSPPFIAGSATASGQLVLTHPVLFNAVFATIQLALALGLWWRPTARAALAGTVTWGLAVWWLGEAFGGLFSGMASPWTGAPGAALLYALIAVLAWPRLPAAGRMGARQSVADAGPLGHRLARAAWVALWGGFAALMFQPQVRADGLVPALILGGTFAVIAAGILVPKATRPVLILAAVLALAIWIFGENFGGLASGSATDPNSGPLLLLLIAAFWPRSAWRQGARRFC